MMHHDIFILAAHAATVSVARQHFLAVPAEAPQRVPTRTVARQAHSCLFDSSNPASTDRFEK
jgi:hypothetical protein